MSEELNERQAKFVDFYVSSGNATQAAIDAGYAKGSAHVTAARLLKNAKVSEAIKMRNKELESKRIADMVEVKQFWTQVMRDPRQNPQDRLKASEFIARTNAAFTDRVAHSGDVRVKIVDDVPKG